MADMWDVLDCDDDRTCGIDMLTLKTTRFYSQTLPKDTVSKPNTNGFFYFGFLLKIEAT